MYFNEVDFFKVLIREIGKKKCFKNVENATKSKNGKKRPPKKFGDNNVEYFCKTHLLLEKHRVRHSKRCKCVEIRAVLVTKS